MTMLSVLVPARGSEGLRERLLGLLDTPLDLEVLVADDGLDGVAEAVAALGDSRARHVPAPPGPGLRDALLSAAAGPYLCMQDDTLLRTPGSLAKQVALLERHAHVDMVYGRVARADEPVGARPPGILRHPYLGGRDEFRDLFFFDHIALPTLVFRRRVLTDVGGMSTDLELAAAHARFWLLKAVRDRQVAFLDEVLAIEPRAGSARGPTAGSDLARRLADHVRVWGWWLLQHEAPPLLDLLDLNRMREVLEASLPEPASEADVAALQAGTLLLGEVFVRYVARMKARFDAQLRDADPFRPGARPWSLDGARANVFLLAPRWAGPAWREVVRAYGEAFGPADEATLVLWLDPSQGVAADEAVAQVMGELAAVGVSPDRAPDMLLVPEALEPADLARLIAAADVVVPAGDERLRAQAARMGRRTLEGLSRAAWHAALAPAP